MPLLTPTSPAVGRLRGLHLYHFGMSNCSQRVRMALSEKRLNWISHPVNLPKNEHATPEYLAINPKGLVPAMVHDGQVIIESLDILDYLDTQFPQPDLKPAAAWHAQAERLRMLADAVQESLKLLSHEFLFKPARRMSPKQLEAFARNHDNAHLVQFMRDFSSPEGFGEARIAAAVAEFDRAFAQVDQSAQASAWLAGAEFSRADIAWLPNVRRLELMRYPLHRFPALWAWYQRAQARPSYREALVAHEPWPLKAFFRAYGALRRRAGTGIERYLSGTH